MSLNKSALTAVSEEYRAKKKRCATMAPVTAEGCGERLQQHHTESNTEKHIIKHLDLRTKTD